MATLTSLSGFAAAEIQNQVKTIENISEEVFKYEMEISHLHENSEYYIIHYNKIYTKQGYNYILKNADGNFYWATPGTKNFIEDSHYPPEFEIKTYEYHKLINEQGNTYLDENKKPILELEAVFKIVDKTKIYKPNEKTIEDPKGLAGLKSLTAVAAKNKVVDDYYVSSYIYGLKYSLDTSQSQKHENKQLNEVPDATNEFKDVNKSHIDNLEKYFKQYHENHEIREDIKFRFDNLEKYVKEKYENETRCFIKLYINEENKEKLKIHLDNIEKYVIDYYEAEAKRILRYY